MPSGVGRWSCPAGRARRADRRTSWAAAVVRCGCRGPLVVHGCADRRTSWGAAVVGCGCGGVRLWWGAAVVGCGCGGVGLPAPRQVGAVVRGHRPSGRDWRADPKRRQAGRACDTVSRTRLSVARRPPGALEVDPGPRRLALSRASQRLLARARRRTRPEPAVDHGIDRRWQLADRPLPSNQSADLLIARPLEVVRVGEGARVSPDGRDRSIGRVEGTHCFDERPREAGRAGGHYPSVAAKIGRDRHVSVPTLCCARLAGGARAGTALPLGSSHVVATGPHSSLGSATRWEGATRGRLSVSGRAAASGL